jgi:RimJ/RimL family protein N-acetyltransferase
MGTISPTKHRLKNGETATIRSVLPDDAAALLAHARSVIDDGEGQILLPDEFAVTEQQERSWIGEHIDDPGKLALVAEVAGQVVGLVHLECGARQRLAHRAILYISVAKDWRNHGVGAALLRTLIEWAENNPRINKLSLAVLATNDRAIALYRKEGFLEEGRRVREIKLGPDQYLDDILMYRFVRREQ